MSASLFFEPVIPKEPDYVNIGYLKHILLARYENLNEGPIPFSREDIPYLNGIMDAGDKDVAEDCKTLIAAIQKYGEVSLFLKH